MRERAFDVNGSVVSRWVQRYAPEINKRIQPHLRMSGRLLKSDAPSPAWEPHLPTFGR
jgi:transposase-like protein